MTNPNQAVKMLIVYAIIIPLAILMGYLLTNPLDYGTLGFIGIILALIISPVFIKWHYPILVFGLTFPAQMFFLKGNPPFWQVVVILSLGIAIVERAINSEKRFLKAPAMTWALIYTAAIVFLTMKLTGGFGLHSLGGGTGGGKKYINLYLGIATFFALASRGIPPAQRNLYVALYFLPGLFSLIGALFPYLPGPLTYINLLFPPVGFLGTGEETVARFGGFAGAATTVMIYMVARYGLRGILNAQHPIRAALFTGCFVLSQLGGFRSSLIGNALLLGFVFFLEGLHRTRLMVGVVVLALLGTFLVAGFSRQLPGAIQRSISFLPVDVDPVIRADADGSTDWRVRIWTAVLPTVPDYLLLGKGYSLSSLDYESMGKDSPFARTAQADASMEGLAISSDFHNGPLSTIICFGVWGCISILAIMAASLHILWRNYKYGDPGLKVVNTVLLAINLEHCIHFFLIFGAYDGDVQWFARTVGFSVALNWGVCRPKPKVTQVQVIRARPAAVETPQAA